MINSQNKLKYYSYKISKQNLFRLHNSCTNPELSLSSGVCGGGGEDKKKLLLRLEYRFLFEHNNCHINKITIPFDFGNYLKLIRFISL